jgi:choline-sulfatase
MSFLTGRHPFQNGVWDNDDTLPSDVATFAHVLGAAGYETALIGRMHFNGMDQWHGFEKRLVGSLGPPFPNGKYPLPPELMVGATCSSRAGVDLAGAGKTAYQVYDEQVSEAAVQYLREKVPDGGRPFCAVVGFVLPHPPFICPKDQWLYYQDRVTVPSVPSGYFEHLHPMVRRWREMREIENLTPEEVKKARAGYYGLVTYHDFLVGKVLRALEEAPDLLRDTVVIYTSDHGEMAGENGMWWKCNFYEGSVSVPLIVAYPQRFKAAQRRDEVVSLIDVGPTLVDLAQAGPWPTATGKSLVPLLSGASVNWMNEAYSEYPPERDQPAERMIRSGKWKLVYFDRMRSQLFNLENDPHEFNDLAEDAGHKEIREKLLEQVLDGWSPKQVNIEVANRQRDQAIIRCWYAKVNPPPSPQQWIAPPGSNVYPES